ncbi:hypothetical protein B0A48_17583 [Cryoendolithus antarcticus]|uniref:DUF1479 domain protein n=1 Tax=Cryoendolithus antarcticus TaxID=1507870 RepID=A0A1V8SBC4_9PEZI|nr:hypothetical protein B0A48_17583 [Cryoendolithus antarcticus]
MATAISTTRTLWRAGCRRGLVSRSRSARLLATAATEKREGDISDAFASLSGKGFSPLDPRFAAVKQQLVAGHEDALQASWFRLLELLQEETALIAEQGSKAIPEVDYQDITSPSADFRAVHRKRGVAVIRNVIPDDEVLAMKDELRAYIAANPHTKAFPPENPQVFELYWSPAQIKARSHPNLLKAQQFLMKFWHSKDPNALVSTRHPAIYADRLRMRLPGDARFALGPHVDGGSCERWEETGYGRGKVYADIWRGDWESYDPWESSCRLPVVSDLYRGVGACSMFRMFQGWLSMSTTGPFQGTLLVNPLLRHSTAYFLLRPFFSSRNTNPESADYLAPSNWPLDLSSTNSWLHGASQGHGQELRPELHPHLKLEETMIHMPEVHPGDYVSWHCDTIHAVDKVHSGFSDSSVMYIPTCPLTVNNAEYLARQRRAFLDGAPSPDFGGGLGESQHIGRMGVEDVRRVDEGAGMRGMGLREFDDGEEGLSHGEREVVARANKILGFYD